MAQGDFLVQLKELGYDAAEIGAGRVAFPYTVQSGHFAGTNVRIGFEVPPDFNLSPPSGPHISPRLYPNQPGGAHPTGGIHDSPFGPEWHYWSRPIPNWQQTERTVRAVMAHVRHLFDEII
jgi:hypothetical protein